MSGTLELEIPSRTPASKWQLDAVERHAIYNGQRLRWEIADHHRSSYALLTEDLKVRGWEPDHLSDCVWRSRGF